MCTKTLIATIYKSLVHGPGGVAILHFDVFWQKHAIT